MEQEAFNLFSAVLGVLTLSITVIGLYAAYVQLKRIKETLWSNTHSTLCDQSFELLKFLSSTPASYGHFYDQKPLDLVEGHDRVIILYQAEALSNFMEHLILQRHNLPAEQWAVWNRYIYSSLKASVVVRNFIHDKREWYSPELLAIVDECKLRYS
ncbi:MAG: hypothetical protein JST66_12760 [Bacteroidetes bacterium]|nr:hypothetical protein [Bacteroidota bacterium]